MHHLQFSGFTDRASLAVKPGAVVFNGRELKPHEAYMLADMLNDCAYEADEKAKLERQACARAMDAFKKRKKAEAEAFAATVGECAQLDIANHVIGSC